MMFQINIYADYDDPSLETEFSMFFLCHNHYCKSWLLVFRLLFTSQLTSCQQSDRQNTQLINVLDLLTIISFAAKLLTLRSELD